jgi:hypothetical protein
LSTPWPGGAHAALMSTRPAPTGPLNFTGADEAVVPTVTQFIYWPSLFLDFTDGPDGEKVVDSPTYSLRVVYQADDSRAAVTDETICID